MKILHLGKYCPPFFGGIENYMMDLGEACDAKGAQVAAICHHHQAGQRFDKRVVRGVCLYRVPTYGQLMFAPISPRFGYYLNKVIDEFQPDVLHIHMPNTSAFFALLSKKAKRLPWVIHWHSDVLGEGSPWFLRLFYPAYGVFESQLLKRADTVIATSPPYFAISPVLRRFKSKCTVVPLGIKPLPVLGGCDTSEDDPKPLQLLMVGRLTYYKGHQYVVEAMALLCRSGVENVHLNIIGTGECFNAVKAQVESLGLSDKIHLLGHVDYQQLLSHLQRADMILLPSIERTEAFGVVLMEAACYGVAAIVSNVSGSGMSYVVADEKTGLVVENKSPKALAAAIERMLQHPQLVRQMGENARKRFVEEFQIEQSAAKILELYQKCTN